MRSGLSAAFPICEPCESQSSEHDIFDDQADQDDAEEAGEDRRRLQLGAVLVNEPAEAAGPG